MSESMEILPEIPGETVGEVVEPLGLPVVATVHLRAALGTRAGLRADDYSRSSAADLGESPPQLQVEAVVEDWSLWTRSSDAHIRSNAALHSDLPAEWQPLLFNDDELSVRAAVVSRPDFPSDLRASAVFMLLELWLAEDPYALEDSFIEISYNLQEAIKLIDDPAALRAVLERMDSAVLRSPEGWSQEAALFRYAIGANSYCPDDVWVRLLEDDERIYQEDMDDGEEVWHGILESRRPPVTGSEMRLRERLVAAIHRDLYGNRGRGPGDPRLRSLVAAYPWTPPEILIELVTIDDSVDIQLFLNPALPDQLQVSAREIETAPPGLRRVFAAGLDPRDHWAFDAIAADSDPGVRMACAENVNVPNDVLQRLAADDD